jgi:hypothetical protein
MVTIIGIGAHLFLRFVLTAPELVMNVPLWFALVVGGGPLVAELAIRLAQLEFGSDLLAGISIVTAILLVLRHTLVLG